MFFPKGFMQDLPAIDPLKKKGKFTLLSKQPRDNDWRKNKGFRRKEEADFLIKGGKSCLSSGKYRQGPFMNKVVATGGGKH